MSTDLVGPSGSRDDRASELDPLVVFGNRPLSPDQYRHVDAYILAIITRQPLLRLRPADEREAKEALWRRFHAAYDGLSGPNASSESDDVRRALVRL